jgi:hypothetical protein
MTNHRGGYPVSLPLRHLMQRQSVSLRETAAVIPPPQLTNNPKRGGTRQNDLNY